MAEPDPPDLQQRLDRFSAGKRAKPKGSRFGIGAMALLLGLTGGAVAWLLASNLQQTEPGLQTSDVEAFQDQRRGTAGSLEFPAEEPDARVNEALIAVEEALEVAVPAPAPAERGAEVLAELAKLREALAASQAARNAEIQSAVGDLRQAFEAQTHMLEAAIAEKEAQLAALERESAARLSGLQTMLDAERRQREALQAEMENSSLIADQHLLEERRRQEEAQKAREAAREADDLLKAQITAPAVVFANGQGRAVASVNSASGEQLTGSEGRQLFNENELYLRQAAAPLKVQHAHRMDFPDRTLAQGSVIQAALQTAINSDLPGNVVAVVSEPVAAFSGDAILIPRGSRLFGQYRSGVKINQRRILILWIRILTPDGISLDIAAVGGDQLGRSGLTGLVDTKFDERFGGAALISIIGAAPAVAADSAGNGTTSVVLGDVGTDLEDAVGSVIADQVSIAPTIYVDQGATVAVLVDRDIVVW